MISRKNARIQIIINSINTFYFILGWQRIDPISVWKIVLKILWTLEFQMKLITSLKINLYALILTQLNAYSLNSISTKLTNKLLIKIKYKYQNLKMLVNSFAITCFIVHCKNQMKSIKHYQKRIKRGPQI